MTKNIFTSVIYKKGKNMKINSIQNFSRINFTKNKTSKTDRPIKTSVAQDTLDMSFINIKNAPNYDEAMAILNVAFEETSDIDKRIFLNLYCKNADGSINLQTAMTFSAYVLINDLSSYEEINNAYMMLLNENDQFDYDKADFIMFGIGEMSKYYFQNNHQSIKLIQEDPNLARAYMQIILSNIADSNRKEDGSIDFPKAEQALNDWLEYTSSDKFYLNSNIMIDIINENQEEEILPMNQAIKKYPSLAQGYDNGLFKLYTISENRTTPYLN